MRITLQRVSSATCRVEKQITGEIDSGLLMFVGFCASDTQEKIELAATKCTELRIFADVNGKLNKSLLDVGGSILLISQFTLYANCTRGRRPDFTQQPLHFKQSNYTNHSYNACRIKASSFNAVSLQQICKSVQLTRGQ